MVRYGYLSDKQDFLWRGIIAGDGLIYQKSVKITFKLGYGYMLHNYIYITLSRNLDA